MLSVNTHFQGGLLNSPEEHLNYDGLMNDLSVQRLRRFRKNKVSQDPGLQTKMKTFFQLVELLSLLKPL